MKIRVKIIGALSKPNGQDDFSFDLPPKSTITDLLKLLGYHEAHLNIIMGAVNGKQKKNHCPLKENDEVELSLPIGGG
jgi:molybdopterin converting factor small subunit